MIFHPSERALSRYADGELTGLRAKRVAAHLESCVECRGVVAAIRELGALARNASAPTMRGGVWERIRGAAWRRRAGDPAGRCRKPGSAGPPVDCRVGSGARHCRCGDRRATARPTCGRRRSSRAHVLARVSPPRRDGRDPLSTGCPARRRGVPARARAILLLLSLERCVRFLRAAWHCRRGAHQERRWVVRWHDAVPRLRGLRAAHRRERRWLADRHRPSRTIRPRRRRAERPAIVRWTARTRDAPNGRVLHPRNERARARSSRQSRGDLSGQRAELGGAGEHRRLVAHSTLAERVQRARTPVRRARKGARGAAFGLSRGDECDGAVRRDDRGFRSSGAVACAAARVVSVGSALARDDRLG